MVITRAGCLRECLQRELRLYFIENEFCQSSNNNICFYSLQRRLVNFVLMFHSHGIILLDSILVGRYDCSSDMEVYVL